MKIDFQLVDFQWDQRNKFKNLTKHGITNEEAEEAFFDPHARTRKTRIGRHLHLGKTFSGKYLFQIFEFVENNEIRIISSRQMTAKEKQIYHRK